MMHIPGGLFPMRNILWVRAAEPESSGALLKVPREPFGCVTLRSSVRVRKRRESCNGRGKLVKT